MSDPWVCPPIAVTVIFGGLGFPVLFELRRPRGWSLHTKLTLGTTGVLLAVGTVFVTGSEWDNPATLGLSTPARLLAGFFQAA